MKKQFKIYSDGGARGNPGPAAIGFIIYDDDGKVLISQAKFIGTATNNVSEYYGIIESFSWIAKNINASGCSLNFYLDSQLVVNQLNGIYKIKDSKMRNLIIKVRQKEEQVRRRLNAKISFNYIPREKNQPADRLVNKALDAA